MMQDFESAKRNFDGGQNRVSTLSLPMPTLLTADDVNEDEYVFEDKLVLLSGLVHQATDFRPLLTPASVTISSRFTTQSLIRLSNLSHSKSKRVSSAVPLQLRSPSALLWFALIH